MPSREEQIDNDIEDLKRLGYAPVMVSDLRARIERKR